MVSSQGEQGRGATPPRRTAGDLARRQNIADAAAGEVGAPTAVGRFQVVIYLNGAGNADISEPRTQCREYADAFGWEVVAEIEDRDALNSPEGRSGLTEAIERLKNGEARAVLTAWRSMISPVEAEFHEVARQCEKVGGFLQVMSSDSSRARVQS